MSQGEIDAVQTALAAEHAVVWGYGLVGAKVSAARRESVRQADGAHRSRRDATVRLVRTLGGEPVATHAEYRTPFPVTDERSAFRLAVHLEEGAAAAWRYVIASSARSGVRTPALAALTDAAVRAAGWRTLVTPARSTVPFPGAPD